MLHFFYYSGRHTLGQERVDFTLQEVQHFHLLLTSVRLQDQTPIIMSKGFMVSKKEGLCQKNGQSLGRNALIIIITFLCKYLTCECFHRTRERIENAPCVVLERSLARRARQHLQPGRALAWRDRSLAKKDGPPVRRDSCRSRGQACAGAESVLPGTYCSVFSLNQLFPHSLCSPLSFLLSAAI